MGTKTYKKVKRKKASPRKAILLVSLLSTNRVQNQSTVVHSILIENHGWLWLRYVVKAFGLEMT